MNDGNMQKAMREKYWDECDQTMQLDRLRDEIISLHRSNQELADMVAKLQQHNHSANGEMWVPFNPPNRSDPPGYVRKPWRLLTAAEHK